MTFDLGFLGGGQLARMSIQAAQRMGLNCLSLDPAADSPASQIAACSVGALDDPVAVGDLMARCGRVTLENEFIPADTLREACRLAGVPESRVMPSIGTLETIQDKLSQRQALTAAGVPSPTAVPLEGDGERAVAEIGFPMVLKARFGGYDGKGTRYARTPEELETHRGLWGDGGWLAEQFVPFKRELAAMVYVSERGEGCFPTMETVQTNHVCDLVFPSGTDASAVALEAVRAMHGRGLFGVELFELEDGTVQVNELAPRPHNSGHYTLDWGGVSQFEQHVRLAMGWPLSNACGDPVCMANLLGQEGARNLDAARGAALEVEGAFVHWYGKSEARAGRKMGHINVSGGENVVDRAVEARKRFYESWI